MSCFYLLFLPRPKAGIIRNYVLKFASCSRSIARNEKSVDRVCTVNVLATYLDIQGVHKVRVHFKKIITLIVFAIEIICKKDLKEENRYFLGFIEILFKFPHVLHHFQYKE